jgi:DNA transposition AAA+ family ATPase
VDANGQPIQIVQQQQPMVQQATASNFYQVPQPQAMQMVAQGNQMANNNKAGAILGNSGVQAVPENAYMNMVSVAQPQQMQQMQQMQQAQIATATMSPSPATRAYTNTAPSNQ